MLALVACALGYADRSFATLVDRSVDLAGGHWHDMPVYVGTVAVIASTRHQHAVAARLFGLVSRHDGLLMLPERAAFARAMKASRASLGDATWDAELERGRRARRTQTEGDIRRALRLVSTVEIAPDAPAQVGTLTRRERDVLRLLADGLTNREIGDALSLSHRTVSTHINNILAKLDVRSRTAAAAFAIRHDID
jgi:DNA-binding NarL/FixJ family response regulator